jgi:hypothetical protein
MGLMGRRAPRLTPGVIEIASLRDASSMVIHGNSGLLTWHHPLLIAPDKAYMLCKLAKI